MRIYNVHNGVTLLLKDALSKSASIDAARWIMDDKGVEENVVNNLLLLSKVMKRFNYQAASIDTRAMLYTKFSAVVSNDFLNIHNKDITIEVRFNEERPGLQVYLKDGENAEFVNIDKELFTS